MSDPVIIDSKLSREMTVNGHLLQIQIYRLLEDTKWSLEVVDEEGNSTVWDDLFATDKAAIDEALKTIETEGLSAFRENNNVVKFPTK